MGVVGGGLRWTEMVADLGGGGGCGNFNDKGYVCARRVYVGQNI